MANRWSEKRRLIEEQLKADLRWSLRHNVNLAGSLDSSPLDPILEQLDAALPGILANRDLSYEGQKKAVAGEKGRAAAHVQKWAAPLKQALETQIQTKLEAARRAVQPTEPSDPMTRLLQRMEDAAILSQPALAGADPVQAVAIWNVADQRTREAMRRAPSRVTAQELNGSTHYSVAPLVDPVILAQHDAELAEKASPELAAQVHDLTELLGAYRAIEQTLVTEIYADVDQPRPELSPAAQLLKDSSEHIAAQMAEAAR